MEQRLRIINTTVGGTSNPFIVDSIENLEQAESMFLALTQFGSFLSTKHIQNVKISSCVFDLEVYDEKKTIWNSWRKGNETFAQYVDSRSAVTA